MTEAVLDLTPWQRERRWQTLIKAQIYIDKDTNIYRQSTDKVFLLRESWCVLFSVLRLHSISSRASCITVVRVVKTFTFLQDTVRINKHNTHTRTTLSYLYHRCKEIHLWPRHIHGATNSP
jgi:hypothetical protein